MSLIAINNLSRKTITPLSRLNSNQIIIIKKHSIQFSHRCCRRNLCTKFIIKYYYEDERSQVESGGDSLHNYHLISSNQHQNHLFKFAASLSSSFLKTNRRNNINKFNFINYNNNNNQQMSTKSFHSKSGNESMSPPLNAAASAATTNSSVVDPDYLDYKDSLEKLNSLQFFPAKINQNASKLSKVRLTYTKNMCKKLNLTDEDINGLNVIHITGTKGKGSTSAFVESILRHSGYKTGLFTSPHLIEVRERIKLNGESLSHKMFSKHFNHCYDALVTNKTNEDEFDVPIYFQILTVMMFHVFVKEKIDVAVIEVGIGGEHDFTNIVEKPVACAITSLGLDHCSLLGNTLEEIAWQKSGIFKPESMAFTVKHDSLDAFNVIKERAKEKRSLLCLAPDVHDYEDKNQNKIRLGLNGQIQYVNSSIALQIANYWTAYKNDPNLDKSKWLKENSTTYNDVPVLKDLKLSQNYIDGLVECKWPARNQIIKANERLTYYIDGAHTVESIDQFIQWFLDLKNQQNLVTKERNVLLFNYTGERDPSKFLEKLMMVKFDKVAFSKLVEYPLSQNSDDRSDTVRKMPSSQMDNDMKYENLVSLFNELKQKYYPTVNIDCNRFESLFEALVWLTDSKDANLFSSLDDEKLLLLKKSSFGNGQNENESQMVKTNVLITGSLYLCGLALKLLNYKIK